MSKGDALLGFVLLLFGFACVGCEVFGAYEFLWAKYHEWNYLVIGGMLVTSLAGILLLAAERARRRRQWGKMVGCWLAIPLALAFVFTAAVQRTGLVADTDEASRKDRAWAITTAQEIITEAKAQLVKDQAAIDANCKIWGPICDKAKGDRRASEKKLAEGRAILLQGATVVDESMAIRIVAFAKAIGWTSITKEQVQLYHPMLLPMLLGLLGSLCVAIGAHGGMEPVERKPGWIARWRARQQETAKVAAMEEPEPVSEPTRDTPPAKPRLVAKSKPYEADIYRKMQAALGPAKGERVELGQCYLHYQAEGGAACAPDEFMRVMIGFCKGAKIRTKEIGGKPYLLDVRLVPQMADREDAGTTR